MSAGGLTARSLFNVLNGGVEMRHFEDLDLALFSKITKFESNEEKQKKIADVVFFAMEAVAEKMTQGQEPVGRFSNTAGNWFQVPYDCPAAINVFPLYIRKQVLPQPTEAMTKRFHDKVEHGDYHISLMSYEELWKAVNGCD